MSGDPQKERGHDRVTHFINVWPSNKKLYTTHGIAAIATSFSDPQDYKFVSGRCQ